MVKVVMKYSVLVLEIYFEIRSVNKLFRVNKFSFFCPYSTFCLQCKTGRK